MDYSIDRSWPALFCIARWRVSVMLVQVRNDEVQDDHPVIS